MQNINYPVSDVSLANIDLFFGACTLALARFLMIWLGQAGRGLSLGSFLLI